MKSGPRRSEWLRNLVVEMWAEGMTGTEIADALGWANGKAAQVRIAQYRAQGYDLPHRRPEMVAVALRCNRLRAENDALEGK